MLGSSSAVVIMLIVILLIGFAILAVLALTRGHGRRLLNKEKYRTAWLEIENNITKDNNSSYQFAILSADKLLDKALKESGVPGDTMGDRLKQSDLGGNINKVVAKRMLAIYKNALKDLGAI